MQIKPNYISETVADDTAETLTPSLNPASTDWREAAKEMMRKKLREEINDIAMRSKELMGDEWAKKWE